MPGLHRYRIRRSDGEVRTVESSAVAITFDGQPATLAVLRDITERNQAEDRVRRLAEIGRIINSTLNIEEVYEPFAQRVRDLIPFERIVITIADPSQGLFTTAYVSGGDVAQRRAGDVANLSNSLTQEVIRTPVRPDHPAEEHRGPEAELCCPSSLFRRTKPVSRSFLSVPLISHDEVIGVLHLGVDQAGGLHREGPSTLPKASAPIYPAPSPTPASSSNWNWNASGSDG